MNDKLYLGKLCKHNHNYKESGKSLRYKTNDRCKYCKHTHKNIKEVGKNSDQTILERFHSSYTIDPETNCWIWKWKIASPSNTIRFSYNYQTYNAKTFSYILYHLQCNFNVFDSTCNNPLCVNPEHLKKGFLADSYSSKFTKEDILYIRSYSNLTEIEKIKELAAKYGVHVLTIKNIISYHTWKHIC